MRTPALLCLLVPLFACRAPSPAPIERRSEPRAPAAASFVKKDGRRLAVIRPEAGRLVGAVHAPDAPASDAHPWLSAEFLVPQAEPGLRELVAASEGYTDLVRRLRGAGYEVVPVPVPVGP